MSFNPRPRAGSDTVDPLEVARIVLNAAVDHCEDIAQVKRMARLYLDEAERRIAELESLFPRPLDSAKGE